MLDLFVLMTFCLLFYRLGYSKYDYELKREAKRICEKIKKEEK